MCFRIRRRADLCGLFACARTRVCVCVCVCVCDRLDAWQVLFQDTPGTAAKWVEETKSRLASL